MAVRLAAAAGGRVLASCRPEDFDSVRAAGAAEVFDYRDPDLHGRIHGCGEVDLYWDTSGHHDLAGAMSTLARGGRIVLSAALGAHPELPVGAAYTRDVSLRGFVISNASVTDLAACARVINAMLAAGSLSARVAQVLPLSEARRAHELIERGEVSGRRIVLAL
jgi:NADPH:quinone reductase-like Zn-dependent oxidoreductase